MASGLLGWPARGASAQALPALTPRCDDGDEPTPRQTSGPFYTPNSPLRSDLREAGMAGEPLILAGLVLTRSCTPLEGVLVELWHADAAGHYDNEGFRLRGHQFTSKEGAFRFSTIVPGLYPGRTRHFHARFQAPDQPVLTTQFYFPEEPANDADRLFNPALLLEVESGPQRAARYDVVLDMS